MRSRGFELATAHVAALRRGGMSIFVYARWIVS